jgi:hypothetical protein
MMPMYSQGDVRRLMRRVARMHPKKPILGQGCVRCRAGDHHAAKWVGPYRICRCLTCPAKSIVVGVAP